MALIIKTDSTFSDASIPVLYPDSAMTESTKFVFDALDPASWSSQAAPTISSSWVDLAGGPAASFPVAPGWDNGFTFAGGSTGAKIDLPASGKVAADQKSGFLAVVWIKPNSVSGLQSIAGSTNGTPAGAQWMMYQDSTQFIMASNGAAGPVISSVIAGNIYQIAIGYEGDGAGNFVRSTWKNGVLVAQQAQHAAASIFQPTAALPSLGRVPGVPSFDGKIYRCVFDILVTEKSIADIVAKDYADNLGRFA